MRLNKRFLHPWFLICTKQSFWLIGKLLIPVSASEAQSSCHTGVLLIATTDLQTTLKGTAAGKQFMNIFKAKTKAPRDKGYVG